MKGKIAATVGSAGLGVVLLGGAALAAFAPEATVASVLDDPWAADVGSERGRPPAGRLEALLTKLVEQGTLTAAQRDAIVAKLNEISGQAKEKRGDWSSKHALAGATKAAAAYLGVTEKELGTALRDGKSIAELAVEKGRTRDGVVAAIVAEATKRVDEAVTAGRLTAEQAATLKAGLAAQAATLVDEKREKRQPKADARPDARDGDRALWSASQINDHFKSTLSYLGLGADAVQEQLRAGKSLAEIALASGKTRDGLVAAIVAPANARIDALVTSGKLTADAAAKAKASAAAAAGKIVDAKRAPKATTTRTTKFR